MKHLAALAMAGMCATTARALESHGTLTLEETQFLSPWAGYQNNTFDLRWDHNTRARHFNADFSLRASDADGQTLTGNVRELNAGLQLGGVHLAAGRFAPENSQALLAVSTLERLNHRVCYNPMECVRGGPIGLEIAHERSFAQISLLAVPNLYPSADVDTAGVLHTTNRWADAPIQSVEIEPGHQFPLRNGGQINGSAETFFKPGLRLGHEFLESTRSSLRWISEVAASHVLTYEKTRLLSFIAQPDGSAQIVVTNQQDGRIEYEQTHALQAHTRLGDWTAALESAYSRKFSGAGEEFTGLAVLGNTSLVLEPSLGVGVIYDTLATPFVQLSLSERWRSWRVATRAVAFLANHTQGLWLAPELGYQISRAHAVSLRANLIQTSKDALYLGDIRGNDNVTLGWTYAY